MQSCRSRWLAEDLANQSIPGVLEHIQDQPWVVQQCLSHVANGYAPQQQLLRYALDVTAHHCQPSDLEAEAAADDGNSFSAASWWLLQRIAVLEQLDGLETFMALTGRSDLSDVSGCTPVHPFCPAILHESLLSTTGHGNF